MFGDAKNAGTIDSAGISANILAEIDKTTATTTTSQLAVASALTDMMSVIPGAGPP